MKLLDGASNGVGRLLTATRDWSLGRRVGWGVLVAAVPVTVGVLVAMWGRNADAQREVCRQNLLQINEPLNHCIPLEQKLAPGAAIGRSDLEAFLKDRTLPRCPSGAEYRVPFVVVGRPVCPIHGDLLAGDRQAEVYGGKPIYPAEGDNPVT